MLSEFTVSCIQFTAIDGEKQTTIEKALHLVRQAGERGSKLVVLPEVWTGLGYSDKTIYRDIAEPISRSHHGPPRARSQALRHVHRRIAL